MKLENVKDEKQLKIVTEKIRKYQFVLKRLEIVKNATHGEFYLHADKKGTNYTVPKELFNIFKNRVMEDLINELQKISKEIENL